MGPWVTWRQDGGCTPAIHELCRAGSGKQGFGCHAQGPEAPFRPDPSQKTDRDGRDKSHLLFCGTTGFGMKIPPAPRFCGN